MEAGWEAGQEATHSLTWDKIISSCPRFLMRIKWSIKEPGRVILETVGVAPNAGQRMLCSSSTSKVQNAVNLPQCLAGMVMAAASWLLHHVG